MNDTIAAEKGTNRVWGPKMKIIATGEICDLKSHKYPDFEIQLPSGAIKHFHRRDLENLPGK
jgi:hypothetical protein